MRGGRVAGHHPQVAGRRRCDHREVVRDRHRAFRHHGIPGGTRPAADIRRVSPAQMGSPPVQVSRDPDDPRATDGGARGDVDRDGRCARPTALTARNLTRWEMPLAYVPVIRSGACEGGSASESSTMPPPLTEKLIVQDRQPAVSGRWEKATDACSSPGDKNSPVGAEGNGGRPAGTRVAHQAWSAAVRARSRTR